MPDTYYSIGSSTMSGIANAVRQKSGGSAQMTPEQIRQAILGIQSGGGSGLNIKISNHLDENDNWVRPSEYPNLDAITIGNDEQVLYLTYDLRKTPGYGWIGIGAYTYTSGTITIDRGHLSNNAFVVDETFSTSGSTHYFRHVLDTTDGDVQLWRVTSASNITKVGFISSNGSSTSTENMQNSLQPCVERRGRLPYLTTIGGSIDSGKSTIANITVWLERCSLILPSTTVLGAQGLASAYAYAYSLQSLDMSGWVTTNWEITALKAMFSNCMSIPKLDLSGWDTSNWAVTTLQYWFYYCMSLKEIRGISALDTSDWAVTDLEQCWSYCNSLKVLDLHSWDTSNWAVTKLNYCWRHCDSLETLNVSGWDTTDWAVTNLSYTWDNCASLKELDVSDWDTSNWAVTNMGNTWNNCFCLETLDISDWDASNWAVTSTAFMSYMYALKTVILPTDLVFPDSATNNPGQSYLLQTVNRFPLGKTHTWSNMFILTPTSLVNILTSLKTVATTQTITLGNNNKLKLTAEQIAIATQKGWTVA